MSLPVITAADGAGWESTLAAGLASPEVGLTVARRCVDVVELVAVAATGQAVAALVDAQLRRLDADVVERLSAVGVAVVGVIAPDAEPDLDRLRSLGIGFAIPANAAVAVFVDVVENAVAALVPGALGNSFGDPTLATGPLRRDAAMAPADPHVGSADSRSAGVTGPVPASPPGRVIVVWGPTGAPGRTMLAANLAHELARLDVSTLLVDADLYGGVVANVLGLLDESPGLVAACRQAQSRRLDRAALAGLCWQLDPRLRVLTGVVRADRWPEVRPAALEHVLDVARQLTEYTVVDVGFGLETDEELSFDTTAPRRNGATLAALECADQILAIGSADAIGLQRLVRGLGELRSIGVRAPVSVVLNRVRSSSVPGSPTAELTAALTRFAGETPRAFLPYDLASLDRALITGKSLCECAGTSPLRRAIADLAASVSGRPTPAGSWHGSSLATRVANPFRGRNRSGFRPQHDAPRPDDPPRTSRT